MHLIIARSLWTNGYDLAAALADVATGRFDGIEGPVPIETGARRRFVAQLQAARASAGNDAIPFIAETVTGGDYVPQHRDPNRHLTELRLALDAAIEAAPRFVTALAGCDAWPLSQSVDFLGRTLALAGERNLTISFETHRSRPTFNPWATLELIRQLPELRLTCDFSHWCCVCERLVLDDEPELLATIAGHAHHLHARVGYAQGPQVAHPAAPEYQTALEAHERWWAAIIAAQTKRDSLTFTPEFGPDGYLQSAPFTGRPVANLDEINRWMADRLRQRFGTPVTLAGAGGGR